MKGSYIVLVMLAAICWGVTGVIARPLMTVGWDPLVLSFYRGAIGFIVVAVWLLYQPRGSGLGNPRTWFWSTLAGVGIAGNFGFYFLSIDTGHVSTAVTLMYSAPVFVYLASFLLKIERPGLLKLTTILSVLVGIVLLTRLYALGISNLSVASISTGLLAGLSYALFIFSFKQAIRYGSPQAILLIAFAILSFILVGPADFKQVSTAIDSPKWPLFALMGTIGAGFSFFIYIVGLQHTAPTMASVLALLEPITATSCSMLFLNESLGGGQITGMLLILISVTALSVHASLKQRPNRTGSVAPASPNRT